jgi:hypothetical protein
MWSNIKDSEKSAVTVVCNISCKFWKSVFDTFNNFLKLILYHFPKYHDLKLVGWGCVIQKTSYKHLVDCTAPWQKKWNSLIGV